MSDDILNTIWVSIPASIRLRQFLKINTSHHKWTRKRLKELSVISDFITLRKFDSELATLVAADFKIVTKDKIVS